MAEKCSPYERGSYMEDQAVGAGSKPGQGEGTQEEEQAGR